MFGRHWESRRQCFHPAALNSKRSRLPLVLLSSGHHGGGSGGSARLVCGVPQVVQLNCALPAPGPSFLGAYKRATSRLWGRRGRRFFVALSPPLSLPRTLPAFSIGAHKAGRHHHLKKANQAHGTAKKRPPPHTPFTAGSIAIAAAPPAPLHLLPLLRCGSGTGAFLDLLGSWSSVA